ncbi:MAG: GGDEF domain-containing protein [Rubellimicrobium sp.]|nr:GGDEF domain-containing protein [Rubellimicrobium sp.]
MAGPDRNIAHRVPAPRRRVLGLVGADWLGVLAIGGLSTVLSVLSSGAAGGWGAEVMVPAVLIPTFIAYPASIVLFRQRRMMADLNARMLDLLQHDPLTGLMSRRFFLAGVEEQRHRGGALLLIDADRFKGINDRFGHPAGDTVLAAMGERLRAASDEDVLLGRLGGEEFAAFAPGRDLDAGRALGEAIRKQVRASPVRTDRGDIAVSVSLGLSLLPPGSSLAAAITAADEALYRAKGLGRDRLSVAGNGVRQASGDVRSGAAWPDESDDDAQGVPDAGQQLSGPGRRSTGLAASGFDETAIAGKGTSGFGLSGSGVSGEAPSGQVRSASPSPQQCPTSGSRSPTHCHTRSGSEPWFPP